MFNHLNKISSLIILILTLSAVNIPGQVNPEFTIGVYFNSPGPYAIEEFDTSGMNTIVWRADSSTHQEVSDHNLIAYNTLNQDDWICYYATSYYSKWEAEEDQTDLNKVGVKHKYGSEATWKYTQCWSTKGVATPTDSLVYGPHYRQEKKYSVDAHEMLPVRYIPRYYMALDNPNHLGGDEPVCKIKVTVRHIRYVNGIVDETLDDVLKSEITLKVSDFPPDSSFKEFYFGITPSEQIYEYPSAYSDNIPNIPTPDTTYADNVEDTGVEFWVEWLRNDNLCTLYIDNIEVYDYEGWSRFLDDPAGIAGTIKNYAESYTSEWPNIIYWYSKDEPQSLDCYTPMRVVDSLVNVAVSKRLITSHLRDLTEPLRKKYPHLFITIQQYSNLTIPPVFSLFFFL